VDRLAAVCQELLRYGGAERGLRLLKDFLAQLDPADRRRAEGFLNPDGAKAPAIRPGIVLAAVGQLCSLEEPVVRACWNATRDVGEMAALLLQGQTSNEALSLADAELELLRLASARSTAQKQALVKEMLIRYRPTTLKYLLRAALGRPLIPAEVGRWRQPRSVEEPQQDRAGSARALVTIRAAELGRGRLATTYTSFTIAVRSGDGFVNVGRVASGLSEAQLRSLTRALRPLVIDRYGSTAVVEPRIVLEVAFSGVQPSARRKAGLVLGSPRIVAWRKDRAVDGVETLEGLRELMEEP
jgi:ATP-dependent DNA ligase